MTDHMAGSIEPLTLARRVLRSVVEERNVRPLRGASESSSEVPWFLEVEVYRLGTPPSGVEIAAGEKKVARVCSHLDELGVPHRTQCGSVVVLNERRCWERALGRMNQKSADGPASSTRSAMEERV